MSVHISLRDPAFNLRGVYLEVGLLGHAVILFSKVLRICHTGFHRGCTVIHYRRQRSSVLISRILANTCFLFCFVLFCFNYNHLSRCEVTPCGLDLHFSNH